MKHTKLIALGTLLLLGVGGGAAQSLGDIARAARKNKPEQTSASRHFDNDNLPTSDGLSVVGPPPEAEAKSAPAAAVDPSVAVADRQKTADELKEKLSKQQANIDSLNHELEIDQRELRLRAAALYADPNAKVRDPSAWDNEDTRLRTDADAKQKALDAARQGLDEIQDQARKAGIDEKAGDDQDNSKNNTPDTSQDKDKDKN
jgi:hypothetical protein